MDVVRQDGRTTVGFFFPLVHVSNHQGKGLKASLNSLISHLEEKLKMSQERILRLRKENAHLEELAEAYKSDWILENRRAVLAEREIPEDSDYWGDVSSCSQPKPWTKLPPRPCPSPTI